MAYEGKNLVGVDIGSSSIKVCQARDTKRGPEVTRYGYAPLPPQTIVDGNIMNSGAVIETLQRLFHDLKISTRQVALSVSGHAVIIKKISVPVMTPAELEEQIQWEAEQHIPFSINDVELDYQTLRTREEQMDLLLVAAKKEWINDYAEVAREAKLKPIVVDIDAFTIQNAFEINYGIPENETVVLLNVGASLTTLNILSGGTSAFTRDIANAGNTITEEIQKQLAVTYDQAESYKRGDGGMVPREVNDIVNSVVEGMAGEIQRSLDFYLATSSDREVARVYLAGGSSRIPALLQAVARRARVQVEPLNPFHRVSVDSKTMDPAALQAHAAQASVAFGLALRKDRERRS